MAASTGGTRVYVVTCLPHERGCAVPAPVARVTRSRSRAKMWYRQHLGAYLADAYGVVEQDQRLQSMADAVLGAEPLSLSRLVEVYEAVRGADVDGDARYCIELRREGLT